MKTLLLATLLALVLALPASAQNAGSARHRRYDPARPVWHDPYFRKLYHDRHHDNDRHGRRRQESNGNGRDHHDDGRTGNGRGDGDGSNREPYVPDGAEKFDYRRR